MFSISSAPLDAAALRARMENTRAGALVVFEGTVREETAGRGVLQLEYEATEKLAQNEFEKIVAEARGRFEITDALAAHRVGILRPGETAVWIGVTAAHRGAAFAACQYLIDELKKRLPIWKKEHYADGASEWIHHA